MEAKEQLDLHTLIFHIFFSMALQNRFHSFLGHQDFVAVWVDQVEWSALWLCRALGRSPETCIWQRVTCALWASCIGSWTQTIPFSDSSYGCKQTCDFNIPGRAHKVFNRESGSPVEKKDRLLSRGIFCHDKYVFVTMHWSVLIRVSMRSLGQLGTTPVRWYPWLLPTGKWVYFIIALLTSNTVYSRVSGTWSAQFTARASAGE